MPMAIARLVFVIQSNQYARSIDVYLVFLNPPGRSFESTQKFRNDFLKLLNFLSYFISMKEIIIFVKKR